MKVTSGTNAGDYPGGVFGWTVPIQTYENGEIAGPTVYGGPDAPRPRPTDSSRRSRKPRPSPPPRGRRRCWSCYAGRASAGRTLILASDGDSGLWIFRYTGP